MPPPTRPFRTWPLTVRLLAFVLWAQLALMGLMGAYAFYAASAPPMPGFEAGFRDGVLGTWGMDAAAFGPAEAGTLVLGFLWPFVLTLLVLVGVRFRLGWLVWGVLAVSAVVAWASGGLGLGALVPLALALLPPSLRYFRGDPPPATAPA